MVITLFYIIISIIFAFIISFPIIDFLYKKKIIRRSEFDDSIKEIPQRKDKVGIPIMGGLIIVITVIVINLFFNFSKSYTLVPLTVFGICSIIGALDDILNIYGRKRPVRKLRHTIMLAMHHAKFTKRIYFTILIPWSMYKSLFYAFGSRLGTGLHPHEKVLVQFIAGSIVAYWIYFKLNWINIWLPGNLNLNVGWLIIPFTIFMIIFMANAVNITDGLDGLSAGALIPAYTTFMIISYQIHNTQISILCATVIGALVTYLYFNIKPARIQMGDVGSLSLGALLATISIILQREIILLIVGLLFIIEIFSVILQKSFKKLTGKKLFLMAPIHHHFEMKGWSEDKVVMRFWLFSIVLMLIALLISNI